MTHRFRAIYISSENSNYYCEEVSITGQSHRLEKQKSCHNLSADTEYSVYLFTELISLKEGILPYIPLIEVYPSAHLSCALQPCFHPGKNEATPCTVQQECSEGSLWVCSRALSYLPLLQAGLGQVKHLTSGESDCPHTYLELENLVLLLQ